MVIVNSSWLEGCASSNIFYKVVLCDSNEQLRIPTFTLIAFCFVEVLCAWFQSVTIISYFVQVRTCMIVADGLVAT